MKRALNNRLSSRPLRLALSLLMLTVSVMLTAEMLGLRGDDDDNLRASRKAQAESLAVQLSVLAGKGDTSAIDLSVLNMVDRNPDVMAASLVRDGGGRISAYGELDQLDDSVSQSTLRRISVPIFDGEDRWGQVQVAFAPDRSLLHDFRYLFFVLASCLGAYTLFLSRALIQLDPSKAVPGRVSSAFNLFSEGVIVLDEKLRVVMGNDAAAAIVDMTADELVGSSLDDWPWVRGDDWQAPWATALNTGMKLGDVPLRVEQKEDQEPRLLMVSSAVVGNENEGRRGVLITINDMTAIEQKNRKLADALEQLREANDAITVKNRELELLATRDPLTGLSNRRALMVSFEQEFARATRENSDLACIICDIDHFKRINDTYGHMVGDEVICAVANTLVGQCREYDHVGRYGGEEFVVVLPRLNTSQTLAIAERIRQEVRRLGSNQVLPVRQLGTSVGVAMLDESVTKIEQMIERADEALYLAKNSGRDQVQLWRPGISATTEHHNETEVPLAVSHTVLEQTRSRVLELEAMVEQRDQDLIALREYDQLTGIPNRTLFLQRIEAEIKRAERLQTAVGILSLEVRDLPEIVANFGHETSDALILAVVRRLEEGLRATDVVSTLTKQHNLSRITTNEYGVLLSDLYEAQQAMPVVTRLKRLLAEPFHVGRHTIYIGASMGISLFNGEEASAFDLLNSASKVRSAAALKSGKITHAFDSDILEKRSHAYMELESDLHDALKNGGLDVHFQPRFNIQAREVCGAEALVRWNHPKRGLIPPDEFIAVAETNGLIHDIWRFVMERSLENLVRWRELGWNELTLSVNISPAQLRERDLLSQVLDPIERFGIPADRLEIELTETSIIHSMKRARIVLTQLRESGISISMDDFGTGYTSLALLADLPLDAVKIDRAFINDMGHNPRSAAIVESVINMAHTLSLRVVGEGVETNEQIAMLSSLGCNEVQGYLIAKPMPAIELENFLSKQRQPARFRRAG